MLKPKKATPVRVAWMPPRDAALRSEIAEHNAEIDRRKAAKKVLKKLRKGRGS